jgi:hypothetical protein
VLWRGTARDLFALPEGETRLGVLLDTETTGLEVPVRRAPAATAPRTGRPPQRPAGRTPEIRR